MDRTTYLKHWTEWLSARDIQEDCNLVLDDLVVVTVGVILLHARKKVMIPETDNIFRRLKSVGTDRLKREILYLCTQLTTAGLRT